MSNYSGQEIKEKYDFLNAKLDRAFENLEKGIFTLNSEVALISQEIEDLQSQCTHEYENGICKFCHTKQEDK